MVTIPTMVSSLIPTSQPFKAITFLLLTWFILGMLRACLQPWYFQYRRRQHVKLYPYARVVEVKRRVPPRDFTIVFKVWKEMLHPMLQRMTVIILCVVKLCWDFVVLFARHVIAPFFLWMYHYLFSPLGTPRQPAPQVDHVPTIHPPAGHATPPQATAAPRMTSTVDPQQERQVSIPRSSMKRGQNGTPVDDTTAAPRKSVAFAQPTVAPTTRGHSVPERESTHRARQGRALTTTVPTAMVPMIAASDRRGTPPTRPPQHSLSNPTSAAAMQSPGFEGFHAMQEPLRLRRQQLLQERQEGLLKRPIDDDERAVSNAKRPRVQPPLQRGRIKLSQCQPTRRLLYPLPVRESNKRARPFEPMDEFAPSRSKRNTGFTYRGYGRITTGTTVSEPSTVAPTATALEARPPDEANGSAPSAFVFGGTAPVATSESTAPQAGFVFGAASNAGAAEANQGAAPVANENSVPQVGFAFGATSNAGTSGTAPPASNSTGTQPVFAFGSAVGASTDTNTNPPPDKVDGQPSHTFGAPVSSASSETTPPPEGTAPTQPAFAFGAAATGVSVPPVSFGAGVVTTDSERTRPSAETQSFGSTVLTTGATEVAPLSQPTFTFGATPANPSQDVSKPPTQQPRLPVIQFGSAPSGVSNPEQATAASLLELTKPQPSHVTQDAQTSSLSTPGVFQFGGAAPATIAPVPAFQFGSTPLDTPQPGPVGTVFRGPTTSTAPAFGAASFRTAPGANPSMPAPQFGAPAFGANVSTANSSPAPRTMARRRAALRERR